MVHGPGPWGGPGTRSMGWSIDPGPCFVYVKGHVQLWIAVYSSVEPCIAMEGHVQLWRAKEGYGGPWRAMNRRVELWRAMYSCGGPYRAIYNHVLMCMAMYSFPISIPIFG